MKTIETLIAESAIYLGTGFFRQNRIRVRLLSRVWEIREGEREEVLVVEALGIPNEWGWSIPDRVFESHNEAHIYWTGLQRRVAAEVAKRRGIGG